MPMFTTLRMRLPVAPSHSPLRTRSANSLIRSSTACTCGTTSTPSTTIDGAAWGAQCDVQHRALLGHVDPVATEHRFDSPAQPRLLGELQQQAQCLVGDAVLRVVEVDPRRIDRQPYAAIRILLEKVSQVEVPYFRAMRLEGLPCLGHRVRSNRRHAQTPLAAASAMRAALPQVSLAGHRASGT